MSGLRLLTLGIGDAFSALHYSSCFLVESAGQWLLIDCPHPFRKILREATQRVGIHDLDVGDLHGVVLTHLHSDHSSGLEGVAFYYRYILGRSLPVYTHGSVAVDLWPRQLAGSMEYSLQEVGQPPVKRTLQEYFDLRSLEEGRPCPIGPFTVTCRPTVHNIPTIALRIEAAGRTLGYSADTTFDPTLIDWLASADLIVHEASGTFMHTRYESLVELPDALKRKLRLIHCPDQFDAAGSELALLQQGAFQTV
jgi:ribonuclease BN (tRNA processing enzyme)